MPPMSSRIEALTAYKNNADGSISDETAGTFTKQTDDNGNTTAYVFKPLNNFNGPVTLTYTISDGNGPVHTQLTRLTIDAVNDAP